MNPDNKPFLVWFGYSRRERRSTFILIIILLIVIVFRYALPEKQNDFKDISGLLASADTGKQNTGNISNKTSPLFRFDPNSASLDTLTTLGLSEKQARTIISYRSKGGKFRQPGDIRKIYGISDVTAERILPYINISGDSGKNENKQVNFNFQKRKYERTELNNADSTKLDALPGIGSVLSARIVKYRKLLGGFVSVEQLKEVYGMPESTFLLVRDRVYADTSLIRYININDLSFNKLTKHPYLDKYDFLAIVKYRDLKGRVSSIEELTDNKVLSENKAKKISPYLKF
jgi:DNA uptake protein ComE-like DNA-binding protein